MAGCDPRQHPAIGGEMYVAYTFWGLKSPGDQQATTDWAFRYTPPASRAGAALSGGQQAPMPAPTPVQQQFGPPRAAGRRRRPGGGGRKPPAGGGGGGRAPPASPPMGDGMARRDPKRLDEDVPMFDIEVSSGGSERQRRPKSIG